MAKLDSRHFKLDIESKLRQLLMPEPTIVVIQDDGSWNEGKPYIRLYLAPADRAAELQEDVDCNEAMFLGDVSKRKRRGRLKDKYQIEILQDKTTSGDQYADSIFRDAEDLLYDSEQQGIDAVLAAWHIVLSARSVAFTEARRNYWPEEINLKEIK